MNRKSGGVLLVVLAVLVVMGMVVTLLASYALERSLLAETRGAESHSGTGEKLSGAIESAVAALIVFEEVAEGLRHPSEGWGRPAETFSGWPEALQGIDVEIFDESDRLGLSLIGEDQWLKILEESGFSSGDASELRDLLLDWIDEDDDERFQGRENSELGGRREPWVPNRRPRSWGEIWSIPEWGEAAFDNDGQLLPWARQLTSMFSLDHEAPGNINSVDSATVEWLNEADVIPYPGWLNERDGVDNEPGTGDERILSEVPGGNDGSLGRLFSADSKVLRIRASSRVGERFVWKEAWIEKGEVGSSGSDRSAPPGVRNQAGVNEEKASSWGEWNLIDVREGLTLVLSEEPRAE